MRTAVRRAIIRAVAVPLALVIVYGLVAGFGLPLLARRAIADWQAQTPGLQVGLQAISFNPWTWTLRAQGLDVRQGGQPLIRVDGLAVGVSISSLPNRAIVLSEVAVQGIELSFQSDAHGHLDIERILPQQRRQRAAKKERPGILWQIDHLAVTALELRVVDPAVGLSDPLELSLPSLDLDHIGTLHGGDDKFTLDLHGRYDGQPVWDLHWQGDVDFAPFSSSGHIQLAHLSLPWLAQSVGRQWPVQLRQGEADFDADYQLAEMQGQQRLSVQRAALDVRQLDIVGNGRSAPEFSLQQLHVQTARIDTVRHQVLGEVLSVESPKLVLHRSEDGQIDLMGLVQQLPKSKTPAPSSPPPVWAVSWPVAEVHSAAIRFDDKSLQGFGDWRLPDVDLHLENLQTIDDAPLRMAALGDGLASDRGSVAVRWSVNGNLRPRSGALHLEWKVQDMNLEQLGVLLARQGRKVIVQKGQLAAQGSVDGDVSHLAQLAATGSVEVRQIDLLAPDWAQVRSEQLNIGPVRLFRGHVQVDALKAQTVHATQADRELDLDQLAATGAAIVTPNLVLNFLSLP